MIVGRHSSEDQTFLIDAIERAKGTIMVIYEIVEWRLEWLS